MAAFKRGDNVVQIVKPVTGVVSGYSVDQETGDTLVKVSWSDSDGDHSRFFTESDLAPVAGNIPVA